MVSLVFLIRQSPDWASLAQDHEAGRKIDVRRYKPDHDIPGFPNRIEHLIAVSNRLFSLNFFRCRHVLKTIALETVRAIAGAQLVAEQDYPVRAHEIATSNALIFYMDDDDFFVPNLCDRLAGFDISDFDIAVFPLVRLGRTIQTFVRADEVADTIIGERRDFDFRFQTNNYGIRAGRVPVGQISRLKDHVLASAFAEQQGMKDRYFDRIISATNKTPCSASGLPKLLRRPEHTLRIIASYVESLRNVPIPDSESWLIGPIAQTTALFDKLMLSTRAGRSFGVAERFRMRLGW